MADWAVGFGGESDRSRSHRKTPAAIVVAVVLAVMLGLWCALD
jgi:hypothetical protein